MTTKEVKKTPDTGKTIAALALVGVIGFGIYSVIKGKKPEETVPVRAHFKFDYLGDPTRKGGTYTLQNRFGHIVEEHPYFDYLPGMIWSEDVNIPTPGTYEMNVDCEVPIGTPPKPYDAEALIRTPEMHQLDYLIKKITSEAITV